MHDSTSKAGPERPRVRRRLGVLVGAAMLVTPLAASPVASAGTLSNVTPESLAAFIAQLPPFLQQIIAGLAQFLSTPVGCSAPNSAAPAAGYADGLSSSLTTVIAPVGSRPCPGNAKAKVKATMRNGHVASIRVVGR